MKKRLLENSVLILIILSIIGIGVTQTPFKTEEFTVQTPGGETFEFNAKHKCGEYLKEATMQVFGVQSIIQRNKTVNQLLAVVKDLARIYNGDVNDRCTIKSLTVKRIE